MSDNSSGERRLGLIIPGILPFSHSNEISEPETLQYDKWFALFGYPNIQTRTVEAHGGSKGLHTIESAYQTALENVLVQAAEKLAEMGCEALSWPCTCASFVGGLTWSENQVSVLSKATGLPATSTSLAMLEAVRTLGADTVDVVSPYPAELSHRFLQFLDDAGVNVAAMLSLDCIDETESNDLDIQSTVIKFDRALPNRAHPMLIPDTAISAIALIPNLEAQIGRPVIAGNQATLWHSLKLLGYDCQASDAGVLLSGTQPTLPHD